MSTANEEIPFNYYDRKSDLPELMEELDTQDRTNELLNTANQEILAKKYSGQTESVSNFAQN